MAIEGDGRMSGPSQKLKKDKQKTKVHDWGPFIKE